MCVSALSVFTLTLEAHAFGQVQSLCGAKRLSFFSLPDPTAQRNNKLLLGPERKKKSKTLPAFSFIHTHINGPISLLSFSFICRAIN